MEVAFEKVPVIYMYVVRTLQSPVYTRVHVTTYEACVYNIQGHEKAKRRLDHKQIFPGIYEHKPYGSYILIA